MKTKFFIFLFFFTISFTIFSQTRKAIPAGRFEALSGIKVSHSTKDSPGISKEGGANIWSEIEKNFPSESGEVLFANMGSLEVGLKSKNFHEAKNIEQGLDLLITSDLQRDKSMTKFLRGKKMIALFDVRPLQKIIFSLTDYEVISYRAEKATNFYLLKTK